MRLLDLSNSRRVPWKNGRGATLELATDAAAPGGDWTWRLSLADVPARAGFSLFPGVDRHIACLTGPGLALERGGTRLIVPREGEGLTFAGEEPVVGAPLGPGVRDANLMTRRGCWTGRLVVARGRMPALDAPLILVHAPQEGPALRASGAGGALEVAAGRTLIATGRVEVAGIPGAVAVACALTPVPCGPS